jgi:hypothetical protein
MLFPFSLSTPFQYEMLRPGCSRCPIHKTHTFWITNSLTIQRGRYDLYCNSLPNNRDKDQQMQLIVFPYGHPLTPWGDYSLLRRIYQQQVTCNNQHFCVLWHKQSTWAGGEEGGSGEEGTEIWHDLGDCMGWARSGYMFRVDVY